MAAILIKNARIVNEGKIFEGDLLLEQQRIEKISAHISAPPHARIIDAQGSFLIPGMIDDQVHFREPGLTHKGNIASESRAAIAGGVTSFIEQPNTVPQAVTQELLEQKYQIAAQSAYANYSFMMGTTNDNLTEILKTNPKNVAGLKIFMGSSTGQMLVDNEQVLEAVFSSTPLLIAVHCEDEQTIQHNLAHYQNLYGAHIPTDKHPLIRSAEACYLSSSKAIALARKTGARLHVFHLSTAREMDLFTNQIPLSQKQITAEVCLHHLWFTDQDYALKGNLIKWNPAVKTADDRQALWEALLDDRIDVIATDHAPHTLEEKNRPYTQSPSGGPLVQHVLPALFEKHLQGVISVEKIVQKTAHNPAMVFQIQDRGFIREGYYADLALIDPQRPQKVTRENILYHCQWSPFEGETFRARVTHTFVNGALVYENQQINPQRAAMRLLFNR